MKIFEALPVGLAIQDQDGRCIFANQASASLPALTSSPTGGAAEPFVQHEQTVVTAAGEQTLLVWQNRVPRAGMTATLALDITERKQVETSLLRRAYFDDLTGLPNRCHLQEAIEDLLARREPSKRFALAFLDVDNFKHVNDYYTHAVGDALLCQVASRLSKLMRPCDLVGRISGDEFLLLVDPIESDEWLSEFMQDVARCLKEPFFIEGFEIFTSASIGVSICPLHGEDYEALRRNADSAMYQAKAGIKGNALIFNWDVGRTVAARMAQEQRLRLAIKDARFCCAYQPKVDLRTRDIIGVEALARLRDEQGEIESPGAFVGLASELGLIDELTQLIFADVIGSVDAIDAAFGENTPVSINVAARQATNVKFMRSFCDELESSGCPSRFVLEVTEDAFVAGGALQTKIVPMLRELGVRLSIDDFGTGYSSLSALADITADELKVDRSFITSIHARPRSQSVLKAIESLSEALGMTLIAEGVETFEELAYLQAATRIRFAQGYYFSKPVLLDTARSSWTAPGRSRAASAESRTEGRRVASNRGR